MEFSKFKKISFNVAPFFFHFKPNNMLILIATARNSVIIINRGGLHPLVLFFLTFDTTTSMLCNEFPYNLFKED